MKNPKQQSFYIILLFSLIISLNSCTSNYSKERTHFYSTCVQKKDSIAIFFWMNNLLYENLKYTPEIMNDMFNTYGYGSIHIPKLVDSTLIYSDFLLLYTINNLYFPDGFLSNGLDSIGDKDSKDSIIIVKRQLREIQNAFDGMISAVNNEVISTIDFAYGNPSRYYDSINPKEYLGFRNLILEDRKQTNKRYSNLLYLSFGGKLDTLRFNIWYEKTMNGFLKVKSRVDSVHKAHYQNIEYERRLKKVRQSYN